jgi:hypothetical protein
MFFFEIKVDLINLMKESLNEKIEIYKLLLSRRIILVLAENLLYLVYAGSCKNDEVLF